jgi:serine phosphatase RsbU (regulator of sigma subunit)
MLRQRKSSTYQEQRYFEYPAMTTTDDLSYYQSYIQRLEAEIDDLTAALSQAWDQLVPFLQEVPVQAETASDIAPILQAVAAAADTEMAGVYLFEQDTWIAVPDSPALSATAQQQLRMMCCETTVDLQLTDARLFHWTFTPIRTEDRMLGILGIGTNDVQHAFTAVEKRIVARMAERIGSQIAAAQLARSREREALHAREMHIAGTIQQSIQPETLPQSHCLQLAAYWQPASQVGGDAWGWVQPDDQRLAWFVLDVSGKGLPAALAAVSLHTAIRLALRMHLSPVEVLRLVNAEFYDSYTRTNLLATVVILTFDAGTRRLELANAGHPPVLLRRNGRWQRIPASVPPVGVLPDLQAEPQQFVLQHQDLLICHSDGFTEIETPLRLWGQTGLLGSVPIAGRNLEQINQAIVTAAQRAGTIQDDQTLVSAMCMADTRFG